ncbi:MAG TPA: toll/interleukin-1 receptor domain-containing protein [Isosphaeraceae bacterium]|nr:toll/interleukin-1 receptor domain-containing protein [Isosphaeraceae bacterium]
MAPDRLCRTPGWRGTTNVVHVVLHGGDRASDSVIRLFPHVQTQWGLSIQAPYSPPRCDGGAGGRGLRCSVSCDGAIVDPYCLAGPGVRPGPTAFAPMTRLADGSFAASFYVRPPPSWAGGLRLIARVWSGVLVVAEATRSVGTASMGGAEPRTASAPAFAKIFVSYAREDLEIVRIFDSVATGTGLFDVWWDLKCLRAGEDWSGRIFEEILSAESFQLLWSIAASRSRHVRREWRFALARRGTSFVRPIYWRDPLVKPPRELSRLHFARISLSTSDRVP